jgi:AcrR family transcriptional regulator
MSAAEVASAAPRRRLAEAERRQVILEAATHVFAERGYEGATISEIAERSQVTRPIVYDHFATKKALLLALIEQHHLRFMTTLATRGEGRKLDEALLRELVDAYLDQVANDPGGWRILCLERSSDPEIADVQRRTGDEVDTALASLLPANIRRAQRLLIARCLRAVGNEISAASLELPRTKRRLLVELMADFCWAGITRIAAGA